MYPDLNPTEPQEPQTYCFKKLTEIEAYLLDEIEVRERLAKNTERFNTFIGILHTSLLTSTVITDGVSIAEFASGAGLLVGIPLSETSLLFSLVTFITQKSFKIFTVKSKNTMQLSLLLKAS